MVPYDRNKPIIVIHTPKTAGTSAYQIFKSWFGNNLLDHYYDPYTKSNPRKYDIWNLHDYQKPVAIYGHFNKARQFGIKDYYPDVTQFITFLRDPYEINISYYFYQKKRSNLRNDIFSPPEGTIEEFLKKSKSNILNFFPSDITFDNFKDIIEENYIEIGLVEFFEESFIKISEKLNMPFNKSMLCHLNETTRNHEISKELKDIFIANNQLEYAIYNYILNKYS
ncbi:MAG: sulfotransferase family 2 domain-containing protein [Bacteroidales bacterium]|nr:sulfotransferase family 2 domain-containing protein [Bacteroidales bacterium]